MPQGYVRFPHISQDAIVFGAEDDLWLVSDEGGRAERLTAAVNEVNYPRFSPDGQWMAFVGKDEGPTEVYVMSAQGGPSRRLTFQAANCQVLGWTPDGQEILYASNADQFTPRSRAIFAINPDGGQPRQLPFGKANDISYGPDGGIVLGRNIREPAYWKRYQGGTAGHLWCDIRGSGTFQRLLNLNGNIAAPCWVGNRIYFLSDHEGIGNIYSCTPRGDDVRRHSDHQDFYARNLSSDGQRMVYHAGADLYLFDPDSERTQRIDVDLPSLRTQRNRKFVSASHYLDSYALHPQGYAVAITTRGKAFSMGNWEGPVLQHGEPDGVRYRLLEWLNDGKRFVAVSDEIGREALVIFNPEEAEEPKVLAGIEFGRVMSLEVSPQDDLVAITNHRNELIMVNLAGEQSIVVDKSDHGQISDLSWSPDGGWLAYCFDDTAQTSVIKLCNIENGETHTITEAVAGDYCPSFDPEGKYLYFLGHRVFNPVNDSLQFERSFPRSVKPYVILLRNDLRSPFIPEPKAPGGKDKEKDKDDNDTKQPLNDTEDVESKPEADDSSLNEAEHGDEQAHQPEDAEKESASAKKPSLQIDLDGITSRVVPFPIPEGRYSKIRGIKGKVLLLQYPIEGTIHTATDSHEPKGSLWSFDFESLKNEYLLDGVSSFDISRDAKTFIYHSHNRLRALKAGDKAPKSESNEPGRDSGWLDLHRIKVSVQPAAEWKQMFAEAWRLQSEHFWVEDMSGVDWQAVYDQYAPLVERVIPAPSCLTFSGNCKVNWEHRMPTRWAANTGKARNTGKVSWV